VCAETPTYRRLCQTHVLSDDNFLEIGCDLGFCCRAVDAILAQSPLSPPLHLPVPDAASVPPPPPSVPSPPPSVIRVLGVDISVSSIAHSVSVSSSPTSSYALADALVPHPQQHPDAADGSRAGAIPAVQRVVDETFGQDKRPGVVAIDLNGTREVRAVLKSLELQMAVTTGSIPQVFVVKNRELFRALVDKEEGRAWANVGGGKRLKTNSGAASNSHNDAI
jgi:hypothetical protein